MDLEQEPTRQPDAYDEPDGNRAKYPPGTALTLDTDTLRKLGIGVDQLPQIGQRFNIAGSVTVTAAEREQGEIEDEASVTFQLTELTLADPDEAARTAPKPERPVQSQGGDPLAERLFGKRES